MLETLLGQHLTVPFRIWRRAITLELHVTVRGVFSYAFSDRKRCLRVYGLKNVAPDSRVVHKAKFAISVSQNQKAHDELSLRCVRLVNVFYFSIETNELRAFDFPLFVESYSAADVIAARFFATRLDYIVRPKIVAIKLKSTGQWRNVQKRRIII